VLMKAVWSEQARNQLKDTSDYIEKEYGVMSKNNFLQEVRRIVTLLEENPNLGKIEALLEEAPVLYRSIVVNRLNKIVYFINSDRIDIVAVWDVRREPDYLKNSVLE